MTPLVFLGVALGGGLGAACRLWLDGVIRARARGTFPWGTVAINLTGSFLLGLLVGLASGTHVPEAALLILGAGFLGGFTTFSTASFETVRLLQDRKWAAGALNGIGVLVVATALAAAGLWFGGAW